MTKENFELLKNQIKSKKGMTLKETKNSDTIIVVGFYGQKNRLVRFDECVNGYDVYGNNFESNNINEIIEQLELPF